MNNQEAGQIIKDGLEDMSLDYIDIEQYEALTMAIKALEQEPSGDLISRQAVIDITWEEPSYTDALNVLTEVRDKVKDLPSVNPQEPKTGHWIPTYGNVKCSVCGSVEESRRVGKATHYCDFCGAKMVEPQESEDKECTKKI